MSPLRLAAAVLALAAGLLLAPAASVAQSGSWLVMFETPGCPWCRKWHREVGDAYHLTAEGRRLPLKRVDISDGIPADYAFLGGIRYTPTFVVIACGREIGRIVGYHAEDAFYGLLGDYLRQLPQQQSC